MIESHCTNKLFYVAGIIGGTVTMMLVSLPDPAPLQGKEGLGTYNIHTYKLSGITQYLSYSLDPEQLYLCNEKH